MCQQMYRETAGRIILKEQIYGILIFVYFPGLFKNEHRFVIKKINTLPFWKYKRCKKQEMTNTSANSHSSGTPLNIKMRTPKIELHFPNLFPIIIKYLKWLIIFFNLEWGGKFRCSWLHLWITLFKCRIIMMIVIIKLLK